MTIEDLRKQNLIILECISGSRAYGLETPTSDTDIRGVFILPQKKYYGLEYIEQISNATNDVIFYELGRFMELLAYNNPNILELLHSPPHTILYKHPFLADIDPKKVLSKLCKDTFGKFAYSQIKKAKGLKKKIVNPMNEVRKSVLAYCFVNHAQGAISLLQFLKMKNWQPENCGLVNIPHMKDIYGLYYAENAHFRGIIRSPDANDVCLSPIPKDAQQVALLYFNRDGYSAYCKEYKAYWEWVNKRNIARYENTQGHGKNYDAKNMMHVFRLLEMAYEIGTYSQINVWRPNRDFLLNVKSGQYEYEYLLKLAEQKQCEMEAAFAQSPLPDLPDNTYLDELTYQLRYKFYHQNSA